MFSQSSADYVRRPPRRSTEGAVDRFWLDVCTTPHAPLRHVAVAGFGRALYRLCASRAPVRYPLAAAGRSERFRRQNGCTVLAACTDRPDSLRPQHRTRTRALELMRADFAGAQVERNQPPAPCRHAAWMSTDLRCWCSSGVVSCHELPL